ncbi:hypothetical protein TNCT_505701 [Trichonephila clavata]|uniref:Uncharacterized protein n=1 Tax=Trichonephila clavata TaxID=2740835 RepID=A0A8X6JPM4_TRICU|nr:hypothetical protein TNCT_505701 [Trichonephila clavata]
MEIFSAWSIKVLSIVSSPLITYISDTGDLSGNKLHVLQKSDFPELRNIDTLLLTSSEITLLKTEAFGNLMYLKQL